MKTRCNIYTLFLGLGLSCCLTTTVQAQITITANDLLGLIGKKQRYESDASGNINVNVGSAGGNRVWDFRGVRLNPFPFSVEQMNQFLSPAAMPFAVDFPQANFAIKNVLTIPQVPDIEHYFYLKAGNTGFVSLGIAPKNLDLSFATRWTAGLEVLRLPLQFGTT